MKNHNHEQFLRTFFREDESERYFEKEVNGFMLVNYWNGATKRWGIRVYTAESFKKYDEARKGNVEQEMLDNDFLYHIPKDD